MFRPRQKALGPAARFEEDARVSPWLAEEGNLRTGLATCGGSLSWWRTFSMPNSLRTFNLFWATRGTAIDQPAIVQSVTGDSIGNTSCDLFQNPAP